jgi:hypothetical protein
LATQHSAAVHVTPAHGNVDDDACVPAVQTFTSAHVGFDTQHSESVHDAAAHTSPSVAAAA